MKTIIWKILKKIANLNIAIITLLLIAILSIFGTILEQDQNLEYYQLHYSTDTPLLGFLTWKTIYRIGLNHMYTNWWFFCLLIFFFSSLTICTFTKQLPAFRQAKQWKFLYDKKSLKKSLYYNNLKEKNTSNLIYSLNLSRYYVFHKKNSFYAYKGIIGRIAPIFVHISIISTLIGSILSLIGGFSAQEIIPNGEIFHIQNITKSGQYSHVPKNFVGKVNHFAIDYENFHIKQYTSEISIISHKNDVLRTQTIAVNSPLKFQSVTFYQTDWKINALRIQIGNNQVIEKNCQGKSDSIYFCEIPINPGNNIFFVIDNLQNGIKVYNTNGQLITRIVINDMILINEIPIVLKEIMTSTGLQIKTDPGLIILYPSFLLLMLSTIGSYLSYSEIWANNHKNNYMSISGTTNRGSIQFEDEISKIYSTYIHLLTRTM